MVFDEMVKNRWGSLEIPPPLLVVVEDVGWWSGFSRPESNEPFRTGMGRMHGTADYSALVRLAEALNTQIIVGFVLCEWDRMGILRDCPSATWKGRAWRGSGVDAGDLESAAAIVNANPEGLCMALHGVGHEYWSDGISFRSEFHDENGTMRSREDVVDHIRFFWRLLASSGIRSPFPEVFIPPALKHSFGDGETGFQKILADAGIRFVITVFDKARRYSSPMFADVTSECGVTLIERGLSPVSWDTVAAEPNFSFSHPVLPLHWANLLHNDMSRNSEVVDAWGAYLADGACRNGFVFFRDAMDALVQIVYFKLARIRESEGGVMLDISDVRRVIPAFAGRGVAVRIPDDYVLHDGDGWFRSESAGEGLVRLIPAAHSDIVRISIK
jgi:hypothetical protein